VRVCAAVGGPTAGAVETIEVVIMPNPKRRHSKTRTAKRRTHDALRAATTGLCPQCHEPKAPHRICPHCGYYKTRQVRPVDEE